MLAILITGSLAAKTLSEPRIPLHRSRSSPQDLEVAGLLPNTPPASLRFLTYPELLSLPQHRFSPEGDSNFQHGVLLAGLTLDELARAIGLAARGILVAAVCDDQYVAHYTSEYRSRHRPILVLSIDGKSPTEWSARSAKPYGPYLVSHADFTPSFRMSPRADEPQIPYGVVELRFLDEKEVMNSIRPPAGSSANPSVMRGYRIAFENCFRCHNQGEFGGRKAAVDWQALSRAAVRDPGVFAAIVRDPKEIKPTARMPANPSYDAADLRAITAYFQAFRPRGDQ
jgi:hypothetical protein